MKKIFLFIIVLLLLTGCNNNENTVIYENTNDNVDEIIEEKYTDDNNTKIGLYFQNGNKLQLITDYKTSIVSGIDIGIFDIYPSNEQEIILSNDFGTSFYNEWISLSNYNNLKIGFNLKYSLNNGDEVSYNILDYNVIYREIYNYLYDDYANRYSSWYSHIKESDYSNETLYTSIKLFAADIDNINSKIIFTVFTYDTEDDFDENNEYRGNSYYRITICDIDKTCD